jgi:rhodanese-related sulfurtransferase
MDDTAASISPQSLYASLGTAAAPIVIDVRRAAAFDEADVMLVSALRRRPDAVDDWWQTLPANHPVVVYCVHGHEVGQDVAASLRRRGMAAYYLEGGIAGWIDVGLPSRRKIGPDAGRWITRERPKIDRIACPWLIRRFIDPHAEFHYVPTGEVFQAAKTIGATPFDIPGAEPFSHDGDFCSFDAFLTVYGITDAPLQSLARIVRGADTGRPAMTPQSGGLLAISLGLSANYATNDHGMLAVGMHVYDALYAWCRGLRDETHTWTPGP